MPAPDDIYEHDVDFTTLALQYPDFAKRLKPNKQLDFSDPESVRQLTKALLHRDFDITIDLPEDRLCPPVPNRFNYILFVQRLLDTTSPSFRDGYDQNRQVIGLDIGTGASAIYPLLACRQRPRWLFLATEIDEKSRSYALRNISSNDLEGRIKIIDTDPSAKTLIPSSELERFERIDILLTNPPFYSSQASMLESASLKSRPPNSSCTGAPIEMITPGGEVAFVRQLIAESTRPANRAKIQWFSSMFGKLSSVSAVVEHLRAHNCMNYAVTEFVQGQKTRRWCVAWSWMGFRPPTSVARGIPGLEKKILPFPSDFDFAAVAGSAISTSTPHQAALPLDRVAAKINNALDALDLLWQYKPAVHAGLGMSRLGDVWSRKARRKRQTETKRKRDRQDQGGEDEEMRSGSSSDSDASSSGEKDHPEPALVFKITLLAGVPVVLPQPRADVPTASPNGRRRETATNPSVSPVHDSVRVHIRWLQGHDSVLFESFCGWLRRKVESSVA